jgi:chemotaxis protein methyltransferase CheR
LAHAIVATVREPLIVLDSSLRVTATNRSFCHVFQVEPAEVQGRLIEDLGDGRWCTPALRQLLQDVLSRDIVIEAHELDLELPTIGRRHMLLNARPVLDEKSSDKALLVALEDVTAQRESEELKASLLKKQEMLLLEVQHRVGNSLQIIASILLMKARNVQSEETRLHLRDVHQRIVSVATVQQQLRVSTFGDDVEVGPYLSKLCESLESSMISDGRITVTSTSTIARVKSNEAVSFGLIVTELVINALKHGFPDGRSGYVAVDFAGRGRDWRLSVSDNGVGRGDKSGVGHVGLGTSIVEALAQQLKAKVEISACSPGATTSIVYFA